MSYSPTLGRWIEQDPTGYVDGSNEYLYEHSTPVNGTDPEGTTYVPGIGSYTGFLMDVNASAGGPPDVIANIDFWVDEKAYSAYYANILGTQLCLKPLAFFQIVAFDFDGTPHPFSNGGTRSIFGAYSRNTWHSDGWQNQQSATQTPTHLGMVDEPSQSLWWPGQTFLRMQFETGVVNLVTGDVYGTVKWGFLYTKAAGGSRLVMNHNGGGGSTNANLLMSAGGAPSNSFMSLLDSELGIFNNGELID